MIGSIEARALALRPGSLWRYGGRIVALDGWPLLVWFSDGSGRRLLGGDVHLRLEGERSRHQSHGVQSAQLATFLRDARRCADTKIHSGDSRTGE